MEYPLGKYLCPTAWRRDELQECRDEKGKPQDPVIGRLLQFQVQCFLNRFQVGSADGDLDFLQPDVAVIDGGYVFKIDAV